LRRSARPKAREQQRQLDVAFGGEHRQQVVHLEHEAHVRAAPLGERRVGHAVDGQAVHFDTAHRGPVETAQQVEQGGLARTGGTHERDEIAARKIQVQFFEHRHAFVAARVFLGDAAQPRDHRIRPSHHLFHCRHAGFLAANYCFP
jgi:hypothetical protein